MTLRNQSPFEDRVTQVDPKVNIFVKQLQENDLTGVLPAAHGPQLKKLKGHFRTAIADFYKREPNKRLVVEIGCHLGKTVRSMAQNHSDTDFVAMDITFKRVVTTAKRANEAQVKNVYSIMANAKHLDELFNENEVDGFVIFFPDPWVRKKSQAKNRLLNDNFSSLMCKVLRPGGFLWLKTDQEPYFQNAAQCFENAGFKPFTGSDPLVPKLLTEEYETTFEHKFRLEGLPAHGGQWYLPVPLNK